MAGNDFMVDLSAIRRRHGVSLSAIADFTKISIRYLRAIESGKFDKLPGGVYNINYIRQYARAIDYSEEDLLQFYRAKAGIEEKDQSAEQRSTGHSIRGWLGGLITLTVPKYSHR